MTMTTMNDDDDDDGDEDDDGFVDDVLAWRGTLTSERVFSFDSSCSGGSLTFRAVPFCRV